MQAGVGYSSPVIGLSGINYARLHHETGVIKQVVVVVVAIA